MGNFGRNDNLIQIPKVFQPNLGNVLGYSYENIEFSNEPIPCTKRKTPQFISNAKAKQKKKIK